MSIFKIKPWWSSQKYEDGNTAEGDQSFSSLKVDKFSSHCESDCILLIDGNFLKIYKPNAAEEVSNIVLEAQLAYTALQIETGKFVSGAADRQILVLHPQSYAVYDLIRKQGHTDAGDQNQLSLSLKHSFTRKAHNLIIGPFGGIKTRDLICVQGLDGSLSFFDQDTFLFMCVFDDVIVPSPIAFVASADSFVLCKSTWIFEIYNYQQLRDFSELNPRQNKKSIPQWAYHAGEEISAVQVIQTSNSFSSIIALGERYLYCFQDNGLMKFIKRFDFMPICFYAYLIGWFYEPTSRLLIMVASDDAKLHIYEGTTLLWSCDLHTAPISLSRCFVLSLPGGIVTLSRSGVVSIGYVGTEPDLSPGGAPIAVELVDPAQVLAELNDVEESLQGILSSTDGKDNDDYKIDKIIRIKADAGRPTQNRFEKFTTQGDETLHLLVCPIVVVLTCEEPRLIQAVQITYICKPPFACTDTTICLNSVNGTEIIETQVLLTSKTDISDANMKLMFTITDESGNITVTSRNILLPLSLYSSPTEVVSGNDVRIEVQTTYTCVDLLDLFSEYSKEELISYKATSDTMSFENKSTNRIITLKSSNQNYFVESKEYPEVVVLLETLVHKLMEYHTRMNIKKFSLQIKIDKEIQTQLIHRFLKSIEAHAKERINLKTLENDLSILQRQFTLIQKRLLVQYGSTPPSPEDCDSLEYLMRDSYDRITKCAEAIMSSRSLVCVAGNTMSSVGRLITFILRSTSTDHTKINLAEELLSLNSLYEDNQNWEESVTQGLTYVLNNIFKKSEKEREKLAPVTEQGVLSHINFKRFMRQIRIIVEKMFAESLHHHQDPDLPVKEKPVARIEELVEVI